MNDVPYVSDYASRLAATWTSRFSALPSASGIVFVSIQALPAERGLVTAFDVTLGFEKEWGDTAAVSLAKHVLADVLEEGKFTLNISALRGVSCAASHPGSHLHS
jgi:hypothetical protein